MAPAEQCRMKRVESVSSLKINRGSTNSMSSAARNQSEKGYLRHIAKTNQIKRVVRS
jgi:hypothetical protein